MDDHRFFRFSVGLIVIFVLGIVLKAAREVIYPFILAIFISYIVDPIIAFILRLKIPKTAAIVLILLGAFAVLSLIGIVVYSSGKTLAAELPRFEQRITDLTGWLEKGVGGMPLKHRVASYIDKVNLQGVASFVLRGLGPVLGLFGKLFLLFLFLAFIVSGRGRVTAKVRKSLSPQRAAQVLDAVEKINFQVRKYLVIKTVMSLINGVSVWVVLAIFGVDFALLFGFLAFLLNYIPNIGSLVATVLRVGFALFQFGTIWTPLWILVITVGMDQVMGNLVEPRLMGKGLGLSPLVLIFSLVFWGWLWGIPGMVMAVPLVAVIKIVCQNIPSLRPAAVLIGS
jgi:predicted PurR-regulated permease PerM